MFTKQLATANRLISAQPGAINGRCTSGVLNVNPWSRGVKTTSTIHPEPVHQDDEKVLEKVLKERENSEDLVIIFILKTTL